MEKIVIGVPYEISIEPSIDIGEFDAEIILEMEGSKIAVELKKIKGTKIDYSFIIPKSLETILGKSTFKYSIFVYKENARFEVDDGKLQFIDEKDFKVKAKDGSKIRPSKEEEKEDKDKEDKEDKEDKGKNKKKSEPPKKEKEKEPVKELRSPAELAEFLIEQEAKKTEEENIQTDKPRTEKIVKESKPVPPATETIKPKPTQSQTNLHEILDSIEKRKHEKALRDKINQNIQDAIRHPD
jgi:hypothetical protein